MDYHSPGSPRMGSSIPDPKDLSRRLLSTQQPQQVAGYGNYDDILADTTSRSRLNTVNRQDQRSPVLIQCCCGKENCENLAAFLRSTESMEDELRLAAEVGQALLQKHEIYQKEIEELQRSLQNQTAQCTTAEQKDQEYEDMVRKLQESQRILILERDDSLKQKSILESKNEAFTEAIDSRDKRILELTRELEKSDGEIKRLMASNLKGEKSEEREEILSRQLEDLEQELAISRKAEHAAELNLKKLKDKFDELFSSHEELKLEQIETQKSKVRLEAVAMLREPTERKELYLSSPNNEANSHLITLIKELSSANNKLKLEISEYRDLLLESRNELSTLQARIEDMETASTTGYPYQASYTSGSFASPFNRNFPPHVLDDIASAGENASHAGGDTEEAVDESNILPGIGARPIHPHMSPSVQSSSFGPGSYNTFNSMGVDASIHSPAGSVVSSSVLSSSNPLHYHHHYHHYHRYPNENPEIVRGSVFGELEKYLMKKTKHKGSRRVGRTSIRKGKKVFVGIGEENEEELKADDAQSDAAIKKDERSEGSSEDDQSYSEESEGGSSVEGNENPVSEKDASHKSNTTVVKNEEKVVPEVAEGNDKVDDRQSAKKKVRTFSSPDNVSATQQIQGVSLLSAGLKRSSVDESGATTRVHDEVEGKSIQAKRSLGKKGAELKLPLRRNSAPLKFSKRPSTSKLTIVASASKQHVPSQPSPLSARRATSAVASSLSVKVSHSSNNSPVAALKSKVLQGIPPIPAFKNPKFATLGPKERKQMMEAWRAGVAKEQQKKNSHQVEGDESVAVKGKNRKSDSPIKAFVEEVLVDEANLSAAEAAALADEVEHGLSSVGTRSVRSRRTSTATRHTIFHVPSITISAEESPKDEHKLEQMLQQSPYQSLFNLASHIVDRIKDTDLLALNRRLKRTFDILELTNLSNNLIENIQNDVEVFREKFRWTEDFRNNEEVKTGEKDIYSFSPENFLPLVHLLQDLLSEICKLRVMINDLQVSYVQKVEESRRKSEEEFDKSMVNGENSNKILEGRDRNIRVQSSDGGFKAYLSKVFGIMEVQSPPSGTRHHSRRLSVDFSHERDVSVASIDTFAEENYYTDRNVETFAGTSNMIGTSKKENNESAVSSFLRQQVVSLFGGGGNNSFISNDSAEKSGDIIESSSTKTKYKAPQTSHSNDESVLKRHQTRRVASLDSGNIPHKNRRSLIAERGLLTDASNTIRSTSSATIQYIGSDGTATSHSLAAAPPPPITTNTPRQLRMSSSSNNLTERLRQHLASPTRNDTTGPRNSGTVDDNSETIWDKIFRPK